MKTVAVLALALLSAIGLGLVEAQVGFGTAGNGTGKSCFIHYLYLPTLLEEHSLSFSPRFCKYDCSIPFLLENLYPWAKMKNQNIEFRAQVKSCTSGYS